MGQNPTEPNPVRLTLTIDDVRNLIAFGNRAQMSGVEADGWVALKHKVLRQVDDQVNKQRANLEVVENE